MNPAAEAANQRQREREASTCVHFNGVQNATCKAGLAYSRPLPCMPPFKDGPVRPTCPKFEATGMEAVLKEEADHAAWSLKINQARAAIIADAKGKRGSQGAIPCPVCHNGPLRYSIAGCNGHVHAKCMTPDCVQWME